MARRLRKNLAYAKVLGMANPTPTYALLEERLGKNLRRYVAAARRAKKSWNAIALDLHAETKVAVTSETLRIWFSGLLKDDETADAGQKAVDVA